MAGIPLNVASKCFTLLVLKTQLFKDTLNVKSLKIVISGSV